MKLTDQQKNLLALYKRSHQDQYGWAKVSKAVWPIVENAPVDLFQVKLTPDGESYGLLRPTDKGMVLLEYVI